MQFELDTVEERFKKVINENLMVGEDYRMRAYMNFCNWHNEIKIHGHTKVSLAFT
jgi:hypothetical protein